MNTDRALALLGGLIGGTLTAAAIAHLYLRTNRDNK